MKRKLILITLAFMLTISSCTSNTSSQNTNKTVSEEIEEVTVVEPKEESEIEPTLEQDAEDINVIDKFIELYNANAETPITNLIDIDIQDTSSGYYRTEFRTYAYKDAIAKHGIASETVSIDLIQYSRGFRIYVLADSYEEIQKVLETTIKIYDSTITNDIIQADIYEKIDFIGSGVSFNINDITGYYEIINRETGSCSVMLDNSPIGFESTEAEVTQTMASEAMSDITETVSDAANDIESDKNIFTIEVTLPASVDDITDEEIEELKTEDGYLSITRNEDQSITYVMTKDKQKELLDKLETRFASFAESTPGSENYPNVTKLEVNNDFSRFTITTTATSKEEISLSETTLAAVFYSFGGAYRGYSCESDTSVIVDYVCESTGEVIASGNSANVE